MSGSVTVPATGPLTPAERVDARRFCGFPAYGDANNGQATWFFFQAYGNLEYRLTNVSDPELAVVRTYLSQLASLEAGILGAADNMDALAAAGGYMWNPREARDRQALFTDWRWRLCAFLGVGRGPELAEGGGNGRIVI